MYHEDYKVKSKRFVMEETRKNLEEVAAEYLNKLIHRNLVQVYSSRINGTTGGCFDHDP